MKRITSILVLGLACVQFSLAQKVSTSSFGKGIAFQAADTSMSMKMTFRMQNLYTAAYNAETESWSSSFQLRRSRLKFSGHAFSPKLTYKAEIGLSSGDISPSREDGNSSGSSRMVLDAVLKYKFADNWEVWVGQTKLPGNRERVVSSADLQFVDRSLVNSRFNIDRDMGFQLHGKLNLGSMLLQPKFALSQGEGRSISSGNQGGFCYTSRLEFLPLGAFEGKKADYVLSDLDRQSTPKVAFGFTYNYNDRAVRQQGQLGSYVKNADGDYVQNSLSHLEADMLFKYKGISSLVEWVRTTGEENTSGFNTGQGITAQAGYLFKSNYEIAGRFTTIAPIDGIASRFSGKENQYTLGFSKYIVGHSLKIQSDITLQQLENVKSNYIYRLQFEMQL